MNKSKSPKTGVKRPGSGRTKGSFSFIIIKKGDLDAKFIDPNQPIQISRKWAEQMGFNVTETRSATDLYNNIVGTTTATKSKVKVEEL